MLILNPDLINSCRVCRSPNQDGDYECLYQDSRKHEERPVLSEAGILYETLLEISLNTRDYYPQFLCNSCDLQMKLFKKLKDKANKTQEYLKTIYEDEIIKFKSEIQQENLESLEYTTEVNERETSDNEFEDNELKEYQENQDECQEVQINQKDEINKYLVSVDNDYQDNAKNEYQEHVMNNFHDTTADYQENVTNEYQNKNYQENAAIEYNEVLGTNEYQEDANNDNQCSTSNDYEENATNNYEDEKLINSQTEKQLHQELLFTEMETINTTPIDIEITSSRDILPHLNTLTNPLKTQPKITDLTYRFSTEEITEQSNNSSENIPQIRLELEPVIDKNDYVTEIYELLDDENEIGPANSENKKGVVEFDVFMEENPDTGSVCSDIEYVIEDEMCSIPGEENIPKTNTTKKRKLNKTNRNENGEIVTRKREYKCESCQLDFQSLQAQKLHRTKVHNEMYPCSVCSKELKSQPALNHHMKLHTEQPAYQCEICQKTFNQKVHYQYHMNRHNNVRNFKCNECEKSFLSKTDLKVHMRFHTGQRPYVCNICGKDYLMMEHLKTHLLIHTDQYFHCDICNNKFATHKTLRMHVKTIHEDEPKFKCSFCSKPFRRKHHLESHLKMHQKNTIFLDNHYEVVDEPGISENEEEYNLNALVDEDFIDEPGFIALSDDIF